MSDRGPVPKDGWHTAFNVTFGILVTAAAVLMFLDPFDEKHFLRSLAAAATVQPLALCGACILTAVVFMPLCVSFVRARSHPEFRTSFPHLFPEKDGGRVVDRNTVVKFVRNLVFLVGVVGVGTYFGLRSYLPMILHDMGQSEQASVPFVIQSASYNRYCAGVTGDNPEFASRRLCGVKLNSSLDVYYGKNVVLTGWRSPYGFRPERYTLPDISHPTE